jgi:hypothetical protein
MQYFKDNIGDIRSEVFNNFRIVWVLSQVSFCLLKFADSVCAQEQIASRYQDLENKPISRVEALRAMYNFQSSQS